MRVSRGAPTCERAKLTFLALVSMIDAALFDKLNRVAKLLRKKPAVPWGGIQVILTGDFFQLPPVTRDREPTFAFEAETWDETISCSFNLTKVFRQKDQSKSRPRCRNARWLTWRSPSVR